MENFIYSSPGKIYRRKTLTFFQKLIASSIWIFVCAGTVFGIYLQQEKLIHANGAIFILIILLPTIIGLLVTIYIGFHPSGPEADFSMPAIEIDLTDSSTINGQITLVDSKEISVEVIVPNVYSSNQNLIEDSNLNSASGFAYQEMFDMALEEIHKKYPDSNWLGIPEVKENIKVY